MTKISPAQLALQILQVTSSSPSTAQNLQTTGENLIAAANGIPATPSPSTHLTSAQTADALFSVGSPNLNKLKIDLIRRTGEVLGIKENDYATSAEYGAALRGALATIKLQPDAKQQIAAIEKKIGLDKLGLSLETVINAIVDPRGRYNDKVDAALQKQIGPENTTKSHGSFNIKPDDIGVYGR